MRPVHDLEDAVGLSNLVLVCPDPDVHSDDVWDSVGADLFHSSHVFLPLLLELQRVLNMWHVWGRGEVHTGL